MIGLHFFNGRIIGLHCTPSEAATVPLVCDTIIEDTDMASLGQHAPIAESVQLPWWHSAVFEIRTTVEH
jgi:hypothetical protein